jgi:hypothetical protein
MKLHETARHALRALLEGWRKRFTLKQRQTMTCKGEMSNGSHLKMTLLVDGCFGGAYCLLLHGGE